MGGKVGDADKAHGHGTAQAQNHPGHADAAGLGDGLHRRGRHKAHQNVRLAKVAQPPGHQRDDADKACAPEQVKLLGRDDGVQVQPLLQITGQGQPGHDRGQQQGGDHQRGLDGVRPAHGQKAANQHVGNRAGRAHPQRHVVGHAEHVFKQTGTSDHARGAIQGEEHQNHQRGDDAQGVALVLEAVGQKVRQRQRIARALGVQAQAGGNPAPVQVSAQAQANGNPRLGQARDVDGPRQAHEQPAAHVRRASRQGRDKTAQAAPAQDVVRQVFGAQIPQPANGQHGKQVNREHDRGGIVPGKLHRDVLLFNS